jgi:ribose transport system permease protein
VLLLVFQTMVPAFLTPENMLDLVQQVSVNAIIAFGMTFTILICGIDLSVGAVLALVGTTVVFLLRVGEPESQNVLRLGLALVGGLAVASVFGFFNGLCAAKTKMPPFIVTLGTMMVARGAALRFNQGRPMHVPDHESLFLALGNGRLFGVIPVPVVIMLVLLAVGSVVLHRTRFGQHLYAIGGNREAARFTGIPVARCEMLVYTMCAALTAVAGIIHASQLYSAEPASGVGFELNAIAAAVVGGTSFTGGIGTIIGTCLGAVIIGTLDKGLNQAGVHFSLQYILKGAVILVAVYVDVRRRRTAGK